MNALTTVTLSNGSSVQLYSAFGDKTVSSLYLANKEKVKRHSGIVHAYFGYTVEDMESYIEKAANEQKERLSKVPTELKQEFIKNELSCELEELL